MGHLVRAGGLVGGDGGQVLDDFFRIFSFTGTGFTSTENGLVLLVAQHRAVGGVGDGVDVGRHLDLLLSPVHVNHLVNNFKSDFLARSYLVRIDGIVFVGVNDDTKETRIGINKTRVVTLGKVV